MTLAQPNWTCIARIAVIWCAFTLVPAPAAAQYRFNYWTTDRGLPQNSIRSILQTRDGYLWFTTLDGVVRYDGAGFRVFDKGNTRGIQSNRFFQLLEDPEGTLWMATEDGGVTRYKDGSFNSYTSADGLGSNVVTSISLDHQSSLLVYTTPTVARWAGGRFSSWTPPPGEPSSGLIHRGQSGALWFYDAAGLHGLKGGIASVHQ